jgi:hypothetical protein
MMPNGLELSHAGTAIQINLRLLDEPGARLQRFVRLVGFHSEMISKCLRSSRFGNKSTNREP